MKSLSIAGTTVYYLEPNSTPHAGIFYFSLSGPDSLTTDPYCHPAQFLQSMGFMIFSITLPCHENNERPQNLRPLWLTNKLRLEDFIFSLPSVHKALTQHFSLPIFAACGLSRGVYIASHLAASIKDITHILGFAPMLALNDEDPLSVHKLTDELVDKSVRFYIGHKDTLVGTDNLIYFISHLIDAQGKQATAQLMISPSVGREGHGTLDSTFQDGCEWLQKQHSAQIL